MKRTLLLCIWVFTWLVPCVLAACRWRGAAGGNDILPCLVAPASQRNATSAGSSASVSSTIDRPRVKHITLFRGPCQVALGNIGYHCGDDDMRWWQFGDATLNALKYYQVCRAVPYGGTSLTRGHADTVR